MKENLLTDNQIRNKRFLSFGIFFLCICASYFIWQGLRNQAQDKGTAKTLRKGFLVNESIFSGLFNKKKLVKTYPVSEAVKDVRVNGEYGLADPSFDPSTWKMKLVKDGGDTLFLTLEDLKKLPKTDVVFDFKCIEGWSQKTWWSGVTFANFVKYYHLENDVNKSFASLSTPDKEYYVGIDMPSMIQPQTLLCYEMNGKPLPIDQGAPLRLIIPVKYGIKHLKRIGTMYFSNNRPPDYWAERGYDYYSGH
ncbi:MAG: molybdopterin-dependent oxidoreductase [Bacteroidota bacterium]|nr:molybdopterin-dependent oxidoreductase [Bacteroidota bacterium]